MPDLIVLPDWLDQTPSIDYTPEKKLLEQVESWGAKAGWNISNGDSLPSELRQRTHVLFEDPKNDRSMRFAVLRKNLSRRGAIRVDASNFRTIELTYRSGNGKWRVEAGGVPIQEDLLSAGWGWLVELLFKR